MCEDAEAQMLTLEAEVDEPSMGDAADDVLRPDEDIKTRYQHGLGTLSISCR